MVDIRGLKTVSKEVYGLILLAIAIGTTVPLLVNMLYFEDDVQTLGDKPSLLKFSSYWELRDFLNRTSQLYPYYWGGVWLETFSAARDASVKAPAEYSDTNIQVAGVDEADIVKTDGEYIYVVHGGNVTIVKAYPPEEARVLAHINLEGIVTGIFINGDKLVVFEQEFPYFDDVRPVKEDCPIYPTFRTFVKVYNLQDREKPLLGRNVSVNGSYFNSRMIGDYIYVLVNEPVYICEDEVILPRVESNGEVRSVEPSDIYYSNVTDYGYGLTTIISVNVQNDEEEPVFEPFLLGATREIYVSLENVYMVIPRYEYTNGIETTEIHRVRIENGKITYEESGEVPGYILNQFSMDEYQGHFRIATTTGHISRSLDEATSENNVYVLNTSLDIIGKLEDLAPGERIYSARFMGDRCYLVTFKKVDPLFVISLEDPQNPEVLGKLKIPGYSDYLHPYDENHLIGIGKETIEAEEGDFAWYQGVKISLFDITDVENPKETAKYEIGDRGTDSPILRDHKALLFDRKRNLLVIPVWVAEIDEEKYPNGVPPYTHGDFVWQGAYIFNISEDELALRGRITHLEDEADLLKSGYYFSSAYEVKRSLYIEDVIYTVSNKKIKMNNLATLEQIGEVDLP